jgi:hypothetical protein
MKRAVATVGTVLLLAVSLSSCDGDDASASKSSSHESSEPTTTADETASESPTEEATEDTSPPPTEVVTSGAGVDGCALVTEELLGTDLGMASGGQLLPQPSSYGDPASKDCYYAAGSGDLIVVKATSRPDTDLPESSSSLGSLPGAEKIDDVDWGWIYVLSPSPTVASVTFAKGDVGLDMAITTGSDVTMEQLQKFAADVVASIG